MASAQVLSNPATSVRKKEHLEAGKRRLEEFRKKRAAEQAKKAGSAGHLYPANVDLHGQQPLDNQHVRLMDSNGAVRSDGVSETFVEPSRDVSDDENKANEFVQNNELASYDTHANPPFRTNYYNSLSGETVQAPVKDQEFDTYNALKLSGTANVNYSSQPQEKNDDFSISMGASDRHVYGSGTDQSIPSGSRLIFDDRSDQPSSYGLEEAHSNDIDTNMKDFRVNPDTSHATDSKHSETSSSSYTSRWASGLASSLHEDSAHPPIKIIEPSSEVKESTHASPYSNDTSTFNMGGRMLGDSVSQFPSGNSIPLWLSESRSTAFSHGVNSSANHEPLYPAVAETTARRSRPSFLDAITLPKVPVSDAGRVESFSSKIHEMDMASSGSQKLFSDNTTIQPFSTLRAPNVSSASVYSMTSSVSAGNVPDMYGHDVNVNSMERKHDSYLRKQDEDFAALEQHIEDLTQEKFSLQRALEASRTLADSLASENSSLTDSYNQQGSVVSQLKSDMEMLQAEIKAQLMELEAIKMEFANVHLECDAADERAKLLASEVIGLEEKTLRLRSSELKLERQLENSQAEISSCKKKMSSLEKDRQDLQATIDALQEEKKLLQAKLRKASASGKFIDVSKSLSNKKDVSTSTEDLIHEDDANSTAESSTMGMHSGAHLLGTNASYSSLLPENGQFNLEASYLNIPPDQMRTIQNINTLISELALEKEELMEALLAESSESSKLKELNNELSKKLEAQTQRLELLTAQSMANVNTPTRPLDPRSMPDNTPYADEGDEVVERVLGWIMKLFPGGPSKRRTSKLL